MRRPAKIAGSAAGNISFVSRVQRLACSSVNRSCMPRSADCSPNSVLRMIGKIEMITQTMTRDVWLVPNQNEISGVRARIGIACSATMYGKIARSASLVWLISTAMPMPSTMAMASPMKATLALDHSASRISENASPLRKPFWTTSWGGLQEEPAPGVEQDVGDEVPDADDDRAEHSGGSTTAAQCSRVADGGVKLGGHRGRDGVGRRRAGRRRRRRRAPDRARRRSSGRPPQRLGDVAAERGERRLEAQLRRAGVGERHLELGDDAARAGATSRAPGCS